MERNVRHVSLTHNQGFIELFFFFSFGTGKLAVVSVSAVHAVCSSGTMWVLLPLGLFSLPFWWHALGSCIQVYLWGQRKLSFVSVMFELEDKVLAPSAQSQPFPFFFLGTILKRWKKNWFDLWSDGHLIYYDDQSRQSVEDKVHMPVDCINIRTGHECRGKWVCFSQLLSLPFPILDGSWILYLTHSALIKRPQKSFIWEEVTKWGSGDPDT